jgi:hypothetical protein
VVVPDSVSGTARRKKALSCPQLIAYNHPRFLEFHDIANDLAVPEVFGAESTGEQFLQLLWKCYQHAFPNACHDSSCSRPSKSSGNAPRREDHFI